MKNAPTGDIINQQIPFKEVLVIGDNGEKLGVMSRNEALIKANELGKDLLLVSPNGKPPVVRILDYGKYKFEKQKNSREAKKKQHIILNKEIRLTINIAQGDLQTKARKATEFLKDGNRVKVSLKFRSREVNNPDFGLRILNQFYELVKEYGKIEKAPELVDRFYDMYLTSNIKQKK